MTWSVKYLYRWYANGCATCTNMNGVYDEEPPEPHPHCVCNVIGFASMCRVLDTQVSTKRTGQEAITVTVTPQGGSRTTSVTTQLGVTAGVSVGYATPGGGPTVGATGTPSGSHSTSDGIVFNYVPAIGGQSQLVWAVTPLFTVTTITTWEAWPTEEQFTTTDVEEARGVTVFVPTPVNADGPFAPPAEGDLTFDADDLEGGDGDEGDEGVGEFDFSESDLDEG